MTNANLRYIVRLASEKKEFKRESAAKTFAKKLQKEGRVYANSTVTLHVYDSVNYTGETAVEF